MKELPILFKGEMVRAILAGTKTQTRRVVKPQPQTAGGMNCTRLRFLDKRGEVFIDEALEAPTPHLRNFLCPYGQPGDRLWVRESFAKIDGQTRSWIETDYRATYTHGDRLGDTLGIKKRWTPSIHMPRSASRITLEVTEVRVERLQDISEADAIAEGIKPYPGNPGRWLSAHRPGLNYPSAVAAYHDLWESINGPGSWDANPWVWVVGFRRLP